MVGSQIEPVQALSEAVGDLTSLHGDMARLHDDQLMHLIVETTRSQHRLDAVRLAAIAELDERPIAADGGYTSTSAWLAAHTDVSWTEARGDVGIARALDDMPETSSALREGDIDLPRVRRLASACAEHRALFRRDEAILVEGARTMSGRDLRRLVDYWRQAADPGRFTTAQERLFCHRRLHCSETIDGMIRIDGDLDPEGGEVVLTALRILTEPAARDDDHRTPSQRRADALVDLCREHLDHGDLPVHGGHRPHVSVTIDLAVLEGRAGVAEIEHGALITGEAARRLACDASVSRVITDGPSSILDIGRRTRAVPAALRSALDLRDGGCTWEGCDRPARWCDAHHIQHWASGGATRLDNLTLLCRRHHRMAHEGARPP